MLTALLIFTPLLLSILVFLLKGQSSKKIAFAGSLIPLAITIIAMCGFTKDASLQHQFNQPWVYQLGIYFNVALDGITLLLVFLTTLLTPIIILSTFNKEVSNTNIFYALILFMEMALIGVFAAFDGFVFYVFWELALIPIYFICLYWGGKDRARITFKFFLYTLVGSLFMLAGLIYVYLHTDPLSFSYEALYKAGAALSPSQQSMVFWLMFLAFAIKMPVFPFHTWQPDTYTESPTAGTMLLSGIMLKMGVFGVIRWMIPMIPSGVDQWMGTAIALSVIGIVYGSWLAVSQRDFKRLIAYSSFAHVGLIAAGVFTINAQGLQGAMIQMVAHGINAVGLFFIVDVIASRTGTRNVNELGGIRLIAPVFATYFLIVLLGSVALPLTNGFVGEFLLLSGVYSYSGITAFFAGLTVILGAVYMLRTYQSTMLGDVSLVKSFPELNINEKAVLIPVTALVIILGVYPKPLLDISEPAVLNIIEIFNRGLGR